MYGAEFWSNTWREARQTSSLGPGYNNEQGWQNFWDLFAEQYAIRNRRTRQMAENVVEHLASEGVVKQANRVLDIGCGPGTYTLPLAARSKEVVGLDTSTRMLSVLQKEAEHFGLQEQVKTTSENWDHLLEERAYDLVFAAKTPAVRDYSSLMKMNKVSRQYCCLVSFAGNYVFALRNQLWVHIMGTPVNSIAFDVQFPFNILYQEGYFPNIKFYSYNHQHQEPLDYLINHYTCYFKIFNREGPEVEAKIRNFLNHRAKDGYCEDTIMATIAVMWWQVKK